MTTNVSDDRMRAKKFDCYDYGGMLLYQGAKKAKLAEHGNIRYFRLIYPLNRTIGLIL